MKKVWFGIAALFAFFAVIETYVYGAKSTFNTQILGWSAAAFFCYGIGLCVLAYNLKKTRNQIGRIGPGWVLLWGVKILFIATVNAMFFLTCLKSGSGSEDMHKAVETFKVILLGYGLLHLIISLVPKRKQHEQGRYKSAH